MFGIGSGVKKGAAKEADAIIPARTVAQQALYEELNERQANLQKSIAYHRESAARLCDEAKALGDVLRLMQQAE